MTPRLRQAKLVDVVRERGEASVEDLAALFATSRETIRRDLTALSEAGWIQKVHGAARLPSPQGEGPFKQRMLDNAEAKRAIAQTAATLIAPGDTLFIDTGSTTLIFAEAAAQIEGLTVVTNSTAIAAAMARNTKAGGIHLLGGQYINDNRETCGPATIAQTGSFYADKAVITVGGLDAKAGVTDFNIEEAQVAEAMIGRADQLIVLADSSKFGRAGAFSVCPLGRIDYLISERKPKDSLAGALKASSVKIQCKPSARRRQTRSAGAGAWGDS